MTRHPAENKSRNTLLFWAALVSSLIGWAPLLAGLISAGAASAFNCQVNEAYARPCMVMGADISDALYNGFMAMFLLIFTAPIIMISLVLWIIFAVFSVRPKRANGANAAISTSSPQDRKPT